jgi:DNA-binding transcriptional regulator/RsmH inhibitor MraZ
MSLPKLSQLAALDWSSKNSSLQTAAKLDSRYRIALPRKSKDKFDAWVYVCPGFDNSLYLFNENDSTTWLASLEQARAIADDGQAALLDLMGYVVVFQLDEQKRLQLTDDFLRAWAGLEEGASYLLTTGADRLCLWSEEAWKARVARATNWAGTGDDIGAARLKQRVNAALFNKQGPEARAND